MAQLEDEFGDIVAKARVGLGLATSQLAERVGLKPSQIADIEAYRLIPDGGIIARVASALALDSKKLEEIATGQWTPESPDLPGDSLSVDLVESPYGNYVENTYIVSDVQSGKGLVVDPGSDGKRVIERISALGIEPVLVMITHAHADHIGGVKTLVAAWPGATIMNHMVERDSVMRNLSAKWEPAKDGVPMHVEGLSVIALATPGHTPGSTCYLIDGCCFVGDTLFAGSIGRPSDHIVYRQMLNEIRMKVLSLPEDTALLPGHGPLTNVGQEQQHNPFF